MIDHLLRKPAQFSLLRLHGALLVVSTRPHHVRGWPRQVHPRSYATFSARFLLRNFFNEASAYDKQKYGNNNGETGVFWDGPWGEVALSFFSSSFVSYNVNFLLFVFCCGATLLLPFVISHHSDTRLQH